MEGKGKAPLSCGRSPSTVKAEPESSEGEQMEKFYALLANIKAMRAMFKGATATSNGESRSSGGGGGGAKKRVRAEEPPWRPVFEMEDFEEAAAGRVAKKQRRGGVKEEEEEGEVVEGKQVFTAELVCDKNSSTKMC